MGERQAKLKGFSGKQNQNLHQVLSFCF